MASVFHDTLQADVEQAQRVSQTIAQLPQGLAAALPYHPVRVLALQPSFSLDELTHKHIASLPLATRNTLIGLGALDTGRGAAGSAVGARKGNRTEAAIGGGLGLALVAWVLSRPEGRSAEVLLGVIELPEEACAATGDTSPLQAASQLVYERVFKLLRAPDPVPAVLLMQDIAVIPMLAIIPLLVVAGESISSDHHGSPVEQFAGWIQTLFVIGAVGLVVLLGRYAFVPILRIIARTRLRELFVASALLIVVGIAFLMELVGLSPALGTFLAGVVLANSEFKHELESDLDPFKGLLLGLFVFKSSFDFTGSVDAILRDNFERPYGVEFADSFF